MSHASVWIIENQQAKGAGDGETMTNLHIWENGCEWVCAESVEDADRVWLEFTGEKTTDGYNHNWTQVPDEKPLSFWCDASGAIAEAGVAENALVKKPASEWVAKLGRCYVGSTEY